MRGSLQRQWSAPSVRRSGLVVLVASLVGHVANYLFYIVSARTLPVGELAQITALTSLGTMTFLPYSGVQAALARTVARDLAEGRPARAQAAVGWTLRRTVVVQGGVALVTVLGAPVAARVLGTPLTTWLLGATWLVLGAGLQVLLGPLQGRARFGRVALLLAGPLGGLRLLFVVPLVLWWGASGAMAALVLATVVGLAVALPGVRPRRDDTPPPSALPAAPPPADPARPAVAATQTPTTQTPTTQAPTTQGAADPVDPGAAAPVTPQATPLPADGRSGAPLAGLTVTVVALLAIASLTNVDVVLAKVNLDPVEAGLYSAAALLGKIAFHGPSALAMVLLPLVTRRLTQGQDVHRPVLGALAVVAGSGLAFCAVLLVAPPSLITGVFGPQYAEGYRYVLGVALVMTAAAVLYVHLMVALAAHDRTFVVVLVVAATVHVLLLSLVARSPGAVVAVSAVSVVPALVWREATSRYGTVPLLSGFLRARSGPGGEGA